MVNKKLIEGINHFSQHPFLANKSPELLTPPHVSLHLEDFDIEDTRGTSCLVPKNGDEGRG